MKPFTRNLVIVLVIFSVMIAGCVAPPKPTNGTPSTGGGKSKVPTTVQETPPPGYVTIETPYGTNATQSSQHVTMPRTTATPDEYVQIYYTTQYFGWNGTAFSYNLTQPPMIINYVVTPVNMTGTKVISGRSGDKKDVTVTYDYFSPYSWFEITVRDKNTEKIIIKDGFGTYKQYPVDTGHDVPRTMKINQPGIIKIDLAGNQITAIVNVSVIKAGNFDA